jgi:hypothetical protein
VYGGDTSTRSAAGERGRQLAEVLCVQQRGILASGQPNNISGTCDALPEGRMVQICEQVQHAGRRYREANGTKQLAH